MRHRIILGLLLLAATIYPATYDLERVYTDPYNIYDDMYYLIKADTILVDSIHCDSVSSTNPCSCSFTLDEDTMYFGEVHAYEDGTGAWLDPGIEIFPRWSDGEIFPTYTVERIYTDPYGIFDTLYYLVKVGNTVRDSTHCDSVEPAAPCTCSFELTDDSIYFAELHAYETGTGWLDPATTVFGRYGYPIPAISGSIADKTCGVSVVVRKGDGRAAQNVKVYMTLAMTARTIDSTGAAIIPVMMTDRTDSLGIAQFTCLWSSYMIPATKWNIQVLVPGGLRRQITVPRDTSYTVDLR